MRYKPEHRDQVAFILETTCEPTAIVSYKRLVMAEIAADRLRLPFVAHLHGAAQVLAEAGFQTTGQGHGAGTRRAARDAHHHYVPAKARPAPDKRVPR